SENELTIYDPAFSTAACHRLFPRSVVGQRSHCPDHEPPRDSQQRLEHLTARYAEFGPAGTRFLEGLLACARSGKNQAERVLSLAAAYPRSDVLAALERAVQYGAFSLQAIARILAAWGQPKTPLDALAEDQRGHLPPWLEENPVSPRPTSDYQGLLSEEPHDAETTDPPAPAKPPIEEPPGLALAPGALDAALSAAEKESLSHLQFLHRLLAGPAEAKLARALERRIRAAGFRELTTLEGFDWEFNAQGVDRRSIEQLATCDFVRRHDNVIFAGQSGLGKSRIIQSLGLTA